MVVDGLLCFHLWSNDTSEVATFNNPFQSHRNPTSFEELRYNNNFVQAAACFWTPPFCPHHRVSGQTNNVCIRTYLPARGTRTKAVWNWKLEITTELWVKNKEDRFPSLVISGVSLYTFLQTKKSSHLCHISFLKWPMWGHIFMPLSL